MTSGLGRRTPGLPGSLRPITRLTPPDQLEMGAPPRDRALQLLALRSSRMSASDSLTLQITESDCRCALSCLGSAVWARERSADGGSPVGRPTRGGGVGDSG